MCRPRPTPHLTMSSAWIGPAELGLGAKRRGDAPLPTHGISKITLAFIICFLYAKNRSSFGPKGSW